jgi:eukaryotic-like serine/threonine-protein kinase
MISRKSEEDQDLFRMAEAVTDGAALDWEGERVAHGDVARQVANLQRIDEVARAYRAEYSGADKANGTRTPGKTPSAEQSGLKTKTLEPSSPPPPDASRVRFVWGSLLVLEKIGEGTYSEVYRAYDPNLKLEVALKLRRGKVSPDDPKVERFLDEARRLAMVRHEHIVTVHGADFHDGRVGLWTDLVRGETLEEIVKERGPLSAKEAACIGIDLCCALCMLHAEGLLHRDIKPSNVMREHHGGKIVLMDFGSAVEFTGTPSLRQRLNGTPLTTAPEVLLDGEPPGPAADIYGLGVLLYWLLSRRYPVEARDLAQLVQKLQSAESVPLIDVRPDVPLALAQVVEKAIARNPAQRFAGPGIMQRALCEALGIIPTPIPPRPWPRRLVQWSVAAGAALALGVAGYAAWRYSTSPKPLDAQAALYRTGNGVNARLFSGAHVRVGDRLSLEIQGSQRMYVYVLNTDERGEAFVLQDADPKQPLEAGVKHVLPDMPEGRERWWRVSSEGGRETVLVIASLRVLPELNKMIANWKRPTAPRSGSAMGIEATAIPTDRSMADLRSPPSPPSAWDPRGMGTIDESQDSDGKARADSLLPNLIRVLLTDESKSKGIWFWQVHLVNDGS